MGEVVRLEIRAVTAMLLTCASLALASLAEASSSRAFTLTARLTPNVLGASTNLSTTMNLVEGLEVPKPLSGVVAYLPAGLRLDVRGMSTCEITKLETDGPRGCPAESRVGFGGGVGEVDLGGMNVKEPYTLDFFLAPREHGHLALLIYANATSPAPVTLVLTAREVPAPRPYGFGLAVDVPSVSSVPGAANASVESSYVSLGSPHAAYYRTIHGHRKLVHLKGLIAPTRCPRGGFPFETIVTFEDHTTSTGSYLFPCPGRR